MEEVAWASRNPERLEQIGKQTRKDMEPDFTAMKSGGEIYLQQFASLQDGGNSFEAGWVFGEDE